MTYIETDLVTTIEQLTETIWPPSPSRSSTVLTSSMAAEPMPWIGCSRASGLNPGMTALDVGSGLGGPARQIARSTGCAVVGVDTTQSYVDTAMALTHAAGLTGQVNFIWVDVTDADLDFLYPRIRSSRGNRCRLAPSSRTRSPLNHTCRTP